MQTKMIRKFLADGGQVTCFQQVMKVTNQLTGEITLKPATSTTFKYSVNGCFTVVNVTDDPTVKWNDERYVVSALRALGYKDESATNS